MGNDFLKDREPFVSDENLHKKTKLQSKSSGSWNFTKIVFLVMLFAVVYLTTVLVSKYITVSRLSMEKEQILGELSSTDREIKDLNEFIQNAQDPEFIEKMARENLKMVRPDESVYFVVK